MFGRDGEYTVRAVSRTQDARYGWRGFRVGEASNPGPRSRSRSPVRSAVATMELDLTRLDSDDDPLVPPSSATRGAVPPLPTWVDSPLEQTHTGKLFTPAMWRAVDSREIVEIRNRFSTLEDVVEDRQSHHGASGGTFVPSVGEEDRRGSTGGAHPTRVATATVVSVECLRCSSSVTRKQQSLAGGPVAEFTMIWRNVTQERTCCATWESYLQHVRHWREQHLRQGFLPH